MKSDVIVVSSKGLKIETALDQAEAVAVYKKLSPKGTLQLRLLTEEMMGLIRSVTGETEGDFWIEENDGLYQLHLKVVTRMSSVKREHLLSASTSGKNEAARGLMGRLRDLFDRDADSDVAGFTSPLLVSGMFEQSSTPMLDYEWSMVRCREALSSSAAPGRDEAWDELEKSVVARVADDVKVSIRGSTVEMTILKKLA